MQGSRRPRERLGTLLLASAVLLASAPEAFGLGDCPYHEHTGHVAGGDHAADRDHSHPADPPDSHHNHPAHDRSGAGPEQRQVGEHANEAEPTRPCTWLADCHLCVLSAPLHSDRVGGRAHPVVGAMQSAAPAADSVLGPRHGLFELHRPNAPPAASFLS